MLGGGRTYTADTELALDGGNQGRALEQGTGQGLEGAGDLGLAAGHLAVQARDTDVLLAGTLLRLDEASGAVHANNQTTSDFGLVLLEGELKQQKKGGCAATYIKGTRVAGFLDTKWKWSVVVLHYFVCSPRGRRALEDGFGRTGECA